MVIFYIGKFRRLKVAWHLARILEEMKDVSFRISESKHTANNYQYVQISRK